MKLDSEHYDSVITLLVRPRVATVWVPKVSSDDERGQATELQGRISGLILMVRIFQVSKKPLGNSTLQRAIDSSLSANSILTRSHAVSETPESACFSGFVSLMASRVLPCSLDGVLVFLGAGAVPSTSCGKKYVEGTEGADAITRAVVRISIEARLAEVASDVLSVSHCGPLLYAASESAINCKMYQRLHRLVMVTFDG